ncbi:MAG: hypothetical protein IKN53_05395 [Oscillibacter sp.]|nr:hypothetical protein [Oscillibacter sp.]
MQLDHDKILPVGSLRSTEKYSMAPLVMQDENARNSSSSQKIGIFALIFAEKAEKMNNPKILLAFFADAHYNESDPPSQGGRGAIEKSRKCMAQVRQTTRIKGSAQLRRYYTARRRQSQPQISRPASPQAIRKREKERWIWIGMNR